MRESITQPRLTLHPGSERSLIWVVAALVACAGCGDETTRVLDGTSTDASSDSPSDAAAEQPDDGGPGADGGDVPDTVVVVEAGDSGEQLDGPEALDSGTDSGPVERAWGPEALVHEDSAAFCGGMRVGVDSLGNAVLAWAVCGAGPGVWSARFVVGKGWGPAERIDAQQAGSGIDAIDLVVGSGGDAVATWARQDDGAASLWTARMSSSGAWSAPETLGPVVGSRFSTAIDDHGGAVAVWRTAGGLQASVYASGTWGAPEQIDPGNGGSQDPSVAISPTGTAVVVWEFDNWGDGDAFRRIWSSTRSDNAWGSAAAVDDTAQASDGSPKIRFLADGDALAVWVRSQGSLKSAVAKRFVAGTGWGTEGGIDLSTGVGNPALALSEDAVGNAFLLISQKGSMSGCGQSSAANICSKEFASDLWGKFLDVDQSPLDVADQRVSAWGDRFAAAVWRQATDIYAGIHASPLGWSKPQLLASGAGVAELAANSQGTAVTAWIRVDGEKRSVFTRRLE